MKTGFRSAVLYLLITLGLSQYAFSANASPPRLNFTDLVSGPTTGLGDGNGSGVIVTVWGQNLGQAQRDSKIFLTNSSGVEHEAAHIYYWKNADGVLPSGPANLYKSHKMQEVAFSIPNVPAGDWDLKVVVDDVSSNALPFKARSGKIYHVMSTGENIAGNDGSYSEPWASIRYALNRNIIPGSTIYVHDSLQIVEVTTGPDQFRPIFWDTISATSDGYNNQMGIIAYPGSHPSTVGRTGVSNYRTSGMVVSKYSIFASSCYEVNGMPVTEPGGSTVCNPSGFGGWGIQGTAYGRVVGNAITDREGRCTTGMQGGIYAVNGSEEDRISGLKIFGNETYEFGCLGTSKFQHTTYISVREGDNPERGVWEFGWNYLHDNQTKFGFHSYDQTGTAGNPCGRPIGTLRIHDNVVVNQSGPGINVAVVRCASWANDIEISNNILINTGRLNTWDGVDPNTADDPAPGAITIGNGGLQGDVRIFNNTIYQWDTDDAVFGIRSCFGFVDGRHFGPSEVDFSQNICITDDDKRYLGFNVNSGPTADELRAQLGGEYNFLYYSGSSPVNALPPVDGSGADIYSNTMTVSPRVNFNLQTLNLSMDIGSPAVRLADKLIDYDIYGIPRNDLTEPGAVVMTNLPRAPSNLSIE